MQNRNFDGLFRRTLGRRVPWAPTGLDGDYVIADCARNPRIHPAVVGSRVESACLYDGPLSPGLSRVAPYLVRLERGSRFANAYYTSGWNDAWGLVLRSQASLRALRRHFRTLAYARRTSGPKLLFRYYDVRVLRLFLPTCDTRQLAQIFGPVDAFVFDGTDGEQPCIASRDDDGALVLRKVRPDVRVAS